MTNDRVFDSTPRRRATWLAASLLMGAMLVPARADDCRDATSQLQLDQCAAAAFGRADGTLNAKYKAVMARLAGQDGAKKLLVAAQEAWLRFRDSECAFESSDSVGGSVHPMVVLECRTELTSARSQRLQHLLSCKEGDVACPLPPR